MFKNLITSQRPSAEEKDISPPVKTILSRMKIGDILVVRKTILDTSTCTTARITLRDGDVEEEYDVTKVQMRGEGGRGRVCPSNWHSSPEFFTREECEALYNTANAILTRGVDELCAAAQVEAGLKNARERALLIEKYNALEGEII